MRLDFHLGEELDRPILLLVQFQNPVYDRDVPPVNLEHNNLPNPDVLLLVVGQEEHVTPLNCRLHTARHNDGDGRLRASDNHHALPGHQG